MCGIAGIFDTRGKRPIERALLHRMGEVLTHRGPDDSGVHVEPGVGLAHRRLSIIDLADGHQPMYNEDGSVAVVYNGEIYNFEELRSDLLARGHAFRTRCDTEVIVHAWEQWAERCVECFRGMFAFALWDRNRATLFLARDRLGIKPLYYAALTDGQVLFGSELKALLVHPALPRDIDPQAVEDYFAYGYVPDPKSILKCARKLAPGHTMTLERGKPLRQPRRYWDLTFTELLGRDEGGFAGELIERLREAVRMRMVADVPLGAFLSGGIDSSSVVAMMAGLTDASVSTCSIAFADPEYDESPYAAQVAERYGTDHFVRTVDPDDFSLVERLAGLYDEPFADSSAIPTYRLSELTRERVKVALSGDGGDETLAGYERYRHHVVEERLRSSLPLELRRALFGPLGALYPKADWAPRPLRAKTTFQALAMGSLEAYFHTVSVMGDALRSQLYTEDFRRDLGGYHAIEVLREHAARAPVTDPLSRIQYLDIKTSLPADILVKVDRASMVHGLEVRVPLLDHPFVEWLATVPPRLKLRGTRTKYLFKQALQPHLSRGLLHRSKTGFCVPLESWFRGPLRASIREALLDSSREDGGIFQRRFVARVLDQHQSGLRDNGAYLWAMLMYISSVSSLHKPAEQPLGVSPRIQGSVGGARR
ncbi:MAG: amidotransferase 1, exosortase A system-associated [Gammaproteobacteria bacterium]|nr:amidotransferase 1, exosortase A system-associated [Gammaproteobacteria bacterium]NIR84453.1 amidotransferase 1, exosortase A system-associated [Gammaproteobacteria bacterium]NIR90934.1 amidotransferase 1, exosortase A system-associated [Gammaproteobacteria bacterium]NIU07120.1 amidotransferase 1, exosortase A system-associated [Gammaproteobacteria bacterium]NIV76249.1 amidotransferase 1, exosortase A system-associated [Gammaproteobacteria bacterium]